MFALNRLKEQSLRRLYKFVLKRVIGQYLDSELVLEQLSVESRTGLVTLRDLHFNCEMLNELLQGLPFHIVSATVSELEATISYDSLLADGCNLKAKGCKIVFAPVSSSNAKSSRHERHPASSKIPQSSSAGEKVRDQVMEEEDPLLFIAQWIEVVIARLQCAVEDLEIIFVSHNDLVGKYCNVQNPVKISKSGPAATIHIHFNNISFFNTHPKMLQDECNASTVASTSLLLGVEATNHHCDADISLLSFRKLVSVENMRVEVKAHTSYSSHNVDTLPILHFTEGGKIDIMIQPPPSRRRSTFNMQRTHLRQENGSIADSHSGHSQSLMYGQAKVDLEVTFPKLICNVRATEVSELTGILNAFVGNGKVDRSRSTNSPDDNFKFEPSLEFGSDFLQLKEGLQSLHQKHTLRHLDRLGLTFQSGKDITEDSNIDGNTNDGDGEVDFDRLSYLLKKYQLTRELLSAEARARQAAPICVTEKSSFLSSPVDSDSEIEFPTDEENSDSKAHDRHAASLACDDELDSGMFFDASEGKDINSGVLGNDKKVRLKKQGLSRLGNSLYSTSIVGSDVFQSAVSGFDKSASDKPFNSTEDISFKNAGGVCLRLLVDSTELIYEDDRSNKNEEQSFDKEELVLCLNEFILIVSAPIDDNSRSGPRFTATVNDLAAYERQHVVDSKCGSKNCHDKVLVSLSAVKSPDMSALVIPSEPQVEHSSGRNVRFDVEAEVTAQHESTVIAGPQVEISGSLCSYDSNSDEGGTNIKVQFQHVSSEVNVATILKWSERLGGIIEMEQEASSSPYSLQCSIQAKSIEVILLGDAAESCRSVTPMDQSDPDVWGSSHSSSSNVSSEEDSSSIPNMQKPRCRTDWSKLSEELRLHDNSRWKKVQSDVSVDSSSGTPPGQLRLVVVGLIVDVTSTNVQDKENNVSLNASSINAFMRLSSMLTGAEQSLEVSTEATQQADMYELGFLSARSLGNRQISFKKTFVDAANFMEDQTNSSSHEENSNAVNKTNELEESIEINTQVVRVHLRSMELNAFIGIVLGILPTSSPGPSEPSSSELENLNSRLKSFFALRVYSHILSVRLAPDTVKTRALDGDLTQEPDMCYCFSVREPQFDMMSTTTRPVNASKKDSLASTTQSPHPACTYQNKNVYSIAATDLSLFEIPLSMLKLDPAIDAREQFHFGGRGNSCRGARFKDPAKTIDEQESYRFIPIIHRTSLETAMMKSGTVPACRNDLAFLKRPQHRALSFSVCMVEDVTLNTTSMSASSNLNDSLSETFSSSFRNTTFDLKLCDMTYRFDPQSTWYLKFPKIFDSIGSTDIVPSREIPSNGNEKSSISAMTVFGRTRLSLNVSKLLLDCCQPDCSGEAPLVMCQMDSSTIKSSPKNVSNKSVESRVLLSVGKLNVSSTLVSNSNRVALSASIADANIRVSNKLLRHCHFDGQHGQRYPCIEQSPVDILGYYIEEGYSPDKLNDDEPIDFDSFVDVHGLVLMGNLNHCSLKIHLNTPNAALASARSRLEREKAAIPECASSNSDTLNVIPITMDCSAGNLQIYGCADSVLVLTDSVCSIVQSINEKNSKTSNQASEASTRGTANQSSSSSVPVPSNTALMISPVSAIRESFVSSDSSCRRDDVADHQIKESKTENKSVKFMDDYDKDSSVMKLRPNPGGPSDKPTFELKKDEEVWGDDIEECLSISEAHRDSGGERSSFDVPLKDSAWMNSLQEDMFAPQSTAHQSVEKMEISKRLDDAVIEEYYPAPMSSDDEERDFEAQYYPQYDYEEFSDGDDLSDVGFEELSDDNDHKGSVINIDSKEKDAINEDLSCSESSYNSYAGKYRSSSTKGMSRSALSDTTSKSNSKMDASMWRSWGVMRSVADLQSQKQEDVVREMEEMVEMSGSLFFKTSAGENEEETHNLTRDGPKSSILDVNIDTDSDISDDEVALPEISSQEASLVKIRAEGREDGDHERAWESRSLHLDRRKPRKTGDSACSQPRGSGGMQSADDRDHERVSDQQAMWYDRSSVHPEDVLPLHIPEPPREKDAADDFIRDHTANGECLITPRVNITVKFSIRVKMFAGLEWSDQTDEPAHLEQSLKQDDVQESNPPKDSRRKARKHDNTASVEKHLGSLVTASEKESSIFSKSSKPSFDAKKTSRNLNLGHKKRPSGQYSRAITNENVRTNRDSADSHTEFTLTACQVVYHMFPPADDESMPLPSERYSVRAHDMLVSFTQSGQKTKKVLGDASILWFNPCSHNIFLGNWLNPSKPTESHLPLIAMTVAGFDLHDVRKAPSVSNNVALEYRLEMAVLPLRCYLDGAFVDFIQKFIEIIQKKQLEKKDHIANTTPSSSTGVLEPPPCTYFQSWIVHSTELKINYSPNPLNFKALQEGDYMQLLNLLSIDSLELSLNQVAMRGISGVPAGLDKTIEEWVKEIYAHQMHRLLTSAGPLRGLSSIGTSIHGLFLVPVQEYRKNGAIGVLKALKRESASLLKTVTRETLSASSKLSHFLASTLIDLITPEGATTADRRHHEAASRARRSEKQPTGFTDSLDRAYEAVSREVTSTLDTIVVLPYKEYQRTGKAGGALKCVVRAIPVAVLRPTAGAAEALSYTLLGLRNNLDPEMRRDEEDVWNVNVRELER